MEVNYRLFNNNHKENIKLNTFGKIIFASLVMGMALWYLKQLNIFAEFENRSAV
jgi:hypothetical protein